MARSVVMPKKVFLVLERGEASEREFELQPNGYRAVGRSGDAEMTHQFTVDGDQALDAEDLARAEAHLQNRHSEPRAGPGPLRINNFRRGSDILLEDVKISRTHALFFLDEDGPSVVDMFSTNGTLVNGRRVDDADLHDGDLIHIGHARFKVRF